MFLSTMSLNQNVEFRFQHSWVFWVITGLCCEQKESSLFSLPFFKLFCTIILNHLKCLFNIYSTVYIENVKFIFKTMFVSECFSLPLQPSLLVYISGMGIF